MATLEEAARRQAGGTGSGARSSVLVTGAGGFLGGHLVEQLAAAGYDVAGLCHKRGVSSDQLGLCYKVFYGDLRHDRVVDQALEGVTGVCHVAAHIPQDLSDASQAAECMEVNALSTLELARRAVGRGVKRFVFASAANAYKPCCEPADEDHPVWPTGHGAWYLTSKLAAELYLSALGVSSDLSPVVLRISSLYGPRARRGVVANFLSRAMRGEDLEVLDGGQGSADLVHVADVAKCFVAALSTGEPGTYNVGSGTTVSTLQLAREVLTVTGSTSCLKVTQPPLPAARFAPLDISKSARTWGFAPMDLRTGLQTCLTPT